MIPDSKIEQGWLSLLKRLPAGAALEQSARTFGAIERVRAVKDASDLLRLALVYGPGGLSLREASVWAQLAGVARLSHVALMKHLVHARDWLAHLTGEVLAARAAAGERRAKGRFLRLADGTTVQKPGSTGVDWRLHLAYDLERQRFTDIGLTDRHGAEKLERARVVAGEIRVVDRCYARPEGLEYIRRGGGDFIARIGARSLRLHHPDGRILNLTRLLKAWAKHGQADVPVLVGKARGWPAARRVPARLIIIPKPPEAAAKSRKAARRTSQKHGTRLHPDTLLAADYLLLLTSLPHADYPAEMVAALYRLRWQIELAIKRLKSLIHIDRLPAKDPDLARSWLYAHLLLALLLEDMTQDFLDSPP